MTDTLVMVGAGGTGSHLLHPLLAYLGDRDYILHIWDADTVERKNLERQLFFEFDIGSLKALALAKRRPDRIEAHIKYLGEENITNAIQDGDTVFICADNMAVRRLINSLAKQLDNITIINGGNELYTGSVQVFAKRAGQRVTPPLDFYSPEFDADNDGPDMAELSCAEIAVLPGGEQTVVANNAVASLMLQALVRVEQDVYSEAEQWTKVTFDVLAGTFQTSDVRLIGGLDE